MKYFRAKANLETLLEKLDLATLGQPVDTCHVNGYRRWEFTQGKKKITISSWADGRRTIVVEYGRKMVSAGCIVK